MSSLKSILRPMLHAVARMRSTLEESVKLSVKNPHQSLSTTSPDILQQCSECASTFQANSLRHRLCIGMIASG